MIPIWQQKEEEYQERKKQMRINRHFAGLEMSWLVGCGFVLYKAIWILSDASKVRPCGWTDILFLTLLFYGFFLGLAALDILTLDGGKRMERIKKLLGLDHISMKLSALAKHLKIRFKHVPEHYECESTEPVAAPKK